MINLFSQKPLPLILAAFLLGAGCTAPETPAAEVPEEPGGPTAEYFLSKDQGHNRWSRTIPPVLTVPSGAVVEVETKEASDEQISATSTVEDFLNMDGSRVHPLTGPVYVEGAEVGDVLAVTLLEIEPLGWGWTGARPGGGFLPDIATEPYFKTFQIDEGATTTRFSDAISIPIRPFPGVMGVAPDTDEMLRTRPPRENGGNMDNKHMIAGTVVYFPILVEGALFSIGDTHAAQGDGEVSGIAIEAPMRIVYQLDVIKGGREISEPQYETDEYFAVTAFAPTIDEAARKATRFMIDYLVEEHHMGPTEAYSLCSLAGDLKISEVVDLPNVLVSMHMPKSVFQ
jgi:acetamidase/formamidase